jgi:hypothetical protein
MSQASQPSGFSQAAAPAQAAQPPRIAGPVIAALLLASFFFQCFWLMTRVPLSESELSWIGRNLAAQNADEGGRVTAGEAVEQAPASSRPAKASAPLVTKLANTPLLALPRSAELAPWQWLFRMPFVMAGLLLGASLWYIARRQFGDMAGYISLALYCFSPVMVARMSSVGPDALTAWGGFGSVYTALAAAHTLYAPRAGVLWNQKRILLLGVALGIAIAAQFSTAILVPIAFVYMLYLVPERWRAVSAIVALACAAAFVFVLVSYGFNFGALMRAASSAHVFALSSGLLTSAASWKMIGFFLLSSSPGVAILLAIAVASLVARPKICFFGISAPLLTAAILMLSGILLPHSAGFGFLVMALPFLFLFIAGVFADLLEGHRRPLFLGVIWAVLLSHAGYSLIGLARISR